MKPQSALAAVTIAGLVVAGTVGLAIADLAPEPAVGGNAARFVPSDGDASLATAGDGTRTLHESARGTGPALLLDEPTAAVAHYFTDLPTNALTSARLWRDTATALDTHDGPVSSLYLLDDAGVSLLTVTGAALGFSYFPALVVLPADAAPGVRWSGEGSAIAGGGLGYATSGEIAAGEGGCLTTTTDTRYTDASSGEELLRVAETASWCPGRGMVTDRSDAGGTRSSFDSRPLSAIDSGIRTDAGTAPAPLDFSSAAGWRRQPLAFHRSDPAYGDSSFQAAFDGLAATTADGTLVLAAAGRVLGFRTDGATATRSWSASPGGDLLQVTALGGFVLVATAERRLVAYDQSGVRLWSLRFPDVVIAQPRAAGDDLVAVSVDGTLRRIRAATGETLWSVPLRTDVAQAPAVIGDVVAVVDRGSTVIARSLADGSARWSTELLSAERLAAGDGILAVQGSTTEVWALDPRDGTQRWHATRPGAARAVLVTAGLVVAQTDEGTSAWDAGSGSRVWTDPAGEVLATDGVRVLLADAREVRVRDAAGALLAALELPAPELGESRSYLIASDGVRIVRSDSTGWLVAP